MRKLSSIAHDVAIWSCPVLCIAGIGLLVYAGVEHHSRVAFWTGLRLFMMGMFLWLLAHGGSALARLVESVRARGVKGFRENPGQVALPMLGVLVLLCVGCWLAWNLLLVFGVAP